MDTHGNFGYGLVTVAPNPATSGTTLSISNAQAADFPTPTTPYNATVWPISVQPISSNAEIVRITAKGAADSGGAGHTQFTITRTQESTSARTIIVGDQMAMTITAKTLTDVENEGFLSTTNVTIGGTVHSADFSTSFVGTGSITNNASSTELDSGATANSSAEIGNGIRFLAQGYNTNISIRCYFIQINLSATGTFKIYLMNNTAYASTPATKYAGYRGNAVAGTDTILAVSKNGTTEQTTDVTAGFGVTNDYSFKILDVILTAGTNVKMYKDGSLLATHSTNFPPSNDTTTSVMLGVFWIDNGTTAASSSFNLTSLYGKLTF